MKTTILTCALALGALALGVQLRAEHQGVKTVAASFDAPPPTCFPDCPPDSKQ